MDKDYDLSEMFKSKFNFPFRVLPDLRGDAINKRDKDIDSTTWIGVTGIDLEQDVTCWITWEEVTLLNYLMEQNEGQEESPKLTPLVSDIDVSFKLTDEGKFINRHGAIIPIVELEIPKNTFPIESFSVQIKGPLRTIYNEGRFTEISDIEEDVPHIIYLFNKWEDMDTGDTIEKPLLPFNEDVIEQSIEFTIFYRQNNSS